MKRTLTERLELLHSLNSFRIFAQSSFNNSQLNSSSMLEETLLELNAYQIATTTGFSSSNALLGLHCVYQEMSECAICFSNCVSSYVYVSLDKLPVPVCGDICYRGLLSMIEYMKHGSQSRKNDWIIMRNSIPITYKEFRTLHPADLSDLSFLLVKRSICNLSETEKELLERIRCTRNNLKEQHCYQHHNHHTDVRNEGHSISDSSHKVPLSTVSTSSSSRISSFYRVSFGYRELVELSKMGITYVQLPGYPNGLYLQGNNSTESQATLKKFCDTSSNCLTIAPPYGFPQACVYWKIEHSDFNLSHTFVCAGS